MITEAGPLAAPPVAGPEKQGGISSSRLPYMPDPGSFARMSSAEIRRCFLLEDLFAADRVRVYHTDLDRACVGGALPVAATLFLEAPPELGSGYFAERRELGIFNIGGPGVVRAGGIERRLGTRDALYVGRGTKGIEFASESAGAPALYYFVSYPAHAEHEARLVRASEAEPATLGGLASANRRTIRKYLRPPQVETCQLTMGLTELEEGSVWNTMPAHTHARRSEIYFYFDLAGDDVVFHYLGEPGETRHVVVRDRQAVAAPGWSIHAGSGTGSYAFIWAMGGENREFSDMQGVPAAALR
jgi:4-deoxy-L-threo-5-hexosulose-uronate ketol-isomerase